MTAYEDILGILKVKDADVHSLFRVGSRVYGCATEASDEDFLVVLHRGKQDLVFRPGINITIHTVESFQNAVDHHSMFALECVFSPPGTRLKSGPPFHFRFNRGRLIAKVVETSESDWKKGVKLWDEEWEASQKKVYHSIRVLMFAKQILEHGHIEDFGKANWVWIEARESLEWEGLEAVRNMLLGQLVTEI